MEGDVGPYILMYVANEDLPSVAGMNGYFGDKVHEARNTQEAFKYSSRRRLQRCVSMLRAQSGDLDGQDKVEMVKAEKYGDIEVANDTYKVGH